MTLCGERTKVIFSLRTLQCVTWWSVVCFQAILLENSHLLATSVQRNGICEVLYAAAWICGEFAEYVTFALYRILHCVFADM